MAYFTRSALKVLSKSENSSGDPTLIHYPTGYTPSGVRSSASGLYGFLDSTWKQYAPQVGVDTSKYPRAYLAPAEVQTAVAAQTPISNWTCPGCNSTAIILANTPANITTTPDTSTSGDSLSFNDNLTFNDPSGLESGFHLTDSNTRTDLSLSPDLALLGAENLTTDALGNPLPGTTDPGTSSSPYNPTMSLNDPAKASGTGISFWVWLSTVLQDSFVRFGVFILGALAVGAAVWSLARETK